MYYDYFGLDEAPFKITPDTRLFYEGGKRGDILEALMYAITSGEGIVKVVGEVGSGKTMLSRMLEVRLSDTVDLVYLANPSIDRNDIPFAIGVELGLNIEPGTDRIRAVHMLQEALLARHAKGRQVVCFVEEAQSMPLATLEEVRLLSNLETHRAKLLQIVLFGQPELDTNLDEPSIRQLRERIVHSFYLDPLGALDVGSYVSFRMRAVGYRGPDVFSKNALKLISKVSEGLIRRVNVLGDKALLAAFAENTHEVTDKHVKIAIRDSAFGRNRKGGRWPKVLGVAAAVLATLIAGAYLSRYLPGLAGVSSPAAPVLAPAPNDSQSTGRPAAAGPTGKIAVATNSSTVSPANGALAPTGVASAPLKSAVPDIGTVIPVTNVNIQHRARPDGVGQRANPQTAPSAVQGASAVAIAATASALDVSAGTTMAAASTSIAALPRSSVARPIVAATTPTPPAGTADSLGRVAQAIQSIEAAQAVEAAGPVSPVRPVKPAQQAAQIDRGQISTRTGDAGGVVTARRVLTPAGESLVDQRLAATRAWFKSVDKEHLTIQLLMTSPRRRQSLEQFLRRWQAVGDVSRVYVYQTQIGDAKWFGVLYNEFGSVQEAEAAIKDLPESLKRHGPYVRNIRDISVLG
jgi:MSHA biogenesis protein MshM